MASDSSITVTCARVAWSGRTWKTLSRVIVSPGRLAVLLLVEVVHWDQLFGEPILWLLYSCGRRGMRAPGPTLPPLDHLMHGVDVARSGNQSERLFHRHGLYST